MSGSSGNTSAGTQGGRTPRGGDQTLTARHGRDLPEGAQQADATDAARRTRTGRDDSDHLDTDAPHDDDRRQGDGDR